MEALGEGYSVPFHIESPLSDAPIILPSYAPQFIKGRALEVEVQALQQKGAVEPAFPSPG